MLFLSSFYLSSSHDSYIVKPVLRGHLYTVKPVLRGHLYTVKPVFKRSPLGQGKSVLIRLVTP